ncbi:MAG: pectinesterase [Gemmatimonadetes bacterium]|nr:pectinesterase [Gemmatimonadota bacterium]
MLRLRAPSLVLLAGLGASALRAQSTPPAHVTIRVDNPLALARHDETVSLPWAELQRRLAGVSANTVRVRDAEHREIPSQVVDDDGDGTLDAIIFQGDFGAKETRHFTIEAAPPTQKYEPKVAVRHDDPRDDMAWESDRAAFRIYGEGLKKTPQAMSSSGIDVWNKKTRALIVEKWYTKKESYHVDTGEGADFYEVGETLGNGGTAGWAKDTIWRADNFKAWRVIATGPIRAIFELKYDPWNVAGTPVSEIKRISIDAGSNLYKATSIFTTPKGGEIPYVIGTLERAGMVGTMSRNNAWAWLTGWGPVAPQNGGHGEMGTAVLLKASTVANWKEGFGHYMAVSSATSGKPVVHYVGSGWTDSGDFPTPQSWWRYLDEMAQRIDAPVRVTIEDARP